MIAARLVALERILIARRTSE